MLVGWYLSNYMTLTSTLKFHSTKALIQQRTEVATTNHKNKHTHSAFPQQPTKPTMAEKHSIILFPFMAQGHIISFLAFALNLEQKSKNYNITIINTPHNIQKLQPSLPPNSYIHLLTFPFISSDHNLPPNTKNTDIVPCNLVIKLIQTSLFLKSSFKNIITKQLQNQNHKLCIIGPISLSDSLNIWCSDNQ